jgi:hypothetical protein
LPKNGTEERTVTSQSDKTTAHLPLLIATAAALYFGLKLLMLTGGDLQTAMALASRLEFLPTIAAMTMNIAPLLLLPFIYLIQDSLLLGRPGSHIRLASAIVYSVLLVFGVLFSAPAIIALIVGFVGAKKFTAYSKKKGWRFFSFDVGLSHLIPGFAGILMPVVFFSSASWIAPEALTLKDAGPIQVFVVSSDDNDTIYLRGDNKTLVRTKNDLIEKQEFCMVGKADIFYSPVYRIFGGAGSYPACPRNS